MNYDKIKAALESKGLPFSDIAVSESHRGYYIELAGIDSARKDEYESIIGETIKVDSEIESMIIKFYNKRFPARLRFVEESDFQKARALKKEG